MDPSVVLNTFPQTTLEERIAKEYNLNVLEEVTPESTLKERFAKAKKMLGIDPSAKTPEGEIVIEKKEDIIKFIPSIFDLVAEMMAGKDTKEDWDALLKEGADFSGITESAKFKELESRIKINLPN